MSRETPAFRTIAVTVAVSDSESVEVIQAIQQIMEQMCSPASFKERLAVVAWVQQIYGQEARAGDD